MNLGLVPQLNGYFSKKITSVDEYEDTIKEIKKTIKQIDGGLQLFYRGDVYCTKVQSKLFRNGCLPNESKNFSDYCKLNKSKLIKAGINTDFFKLAYMQHHTSSTRLLDFSTDPLVALRFACGEKNDCPKKITIYAVTSDLNVEKSEYSKTIKILMEFVKSDSNNINFSEIAANAGVSEDEVKEILLKDYFIAPPSNFPFERIKRQKGSFLFMGNRTDAQLFSDEAVPALEISPTKVKHQLSPSFGRGFQYDGYVGVLTIAKESIPTIRNTLDCRHTYSDYNIDYLMETTP